MLTCGYPQILRTCVWRIGKLFGGHEFNFAGMELFVADMQFSSTNLNCCPRPRTNPGTGACQEMSIPGTGRCPENIEPRDWTCQEMSNRRNVEPTYPKMSKRPLSKRPPSRGGAAIPPTPRAHSRQASPPDPVGTFCLPRNV